MPARRPHQGPPDHAEGPPSAQARADLAGELRREVADARLRLEEATLRAEAHRLLGDDEAAAAAVGEQEAALADVEGRLARVVSAAVVQRDAEQVLADAARQTPPVVEPVAAPAPADAPRRVPVLSGVASVVAALGVAVAAVLGLNSTTQVQVTDAASGATEPPAPTAPADSPTDQDPAPTADVTTDAPASASPEASTTPGRVIAADPTADADGASEADGPTEDPTDPAPTPDTEFDEVVGQLVDAVAGLGAEDPPGSEPSPDVDATVPDEDPDGGLVPDDLSTAGDGFVPDPLGE
jgi:hypothetical protein